MARPAKLLSEYYDEHQLADELGHNAATLRRWRREGKGPPFTTVGRRALYRKSGVAAWLRDREQGAVA
jgi:hypothetical protein